MKTILVDAFNTFVTSDGNINREMEEMLNKFENRKIILTNADKEKQVELWLVDLPYEMFTQNFNPLKIEPTYFENFFKEYDLNICDVIYFEHDLGAVESARSLWITTYHYDKEKKDIKALEWFLRNYI